MITSTDNPRIKAYAKLKNARERKRTGLFLIEGHREVARALNAEVAVDTLLVCDELLGPEPIETAGSDVLEIGAAPMRKIAMRENPPGVVAVARQFGTSLSELHVGEDPLLLIVEEVEKPGNLGAMMRTCDAVGADALIVAEPVTDIFNPNVVRASQGALFSVATAVAGTNEVIGWCRKRGITVVGGYPAASTELWDASLTGAVAMLVGAEDAGISAAWDDVATPVRIPMAGAADSLNASVSAALLLYEAKRQRR
ncbi:MAG: TrmH family RNA methyltransferase [Acidimicrobiia bacterium]|nr:TrmH family RNA methyltransferase [Acidimicrobiia bacterium]